MRRNVNGGRWIKVVFEKNVDECEVEQFNFDFG